MSLVETEIGLEIDEERFLEAGAVDRRDVPVWPALEEVVRARQVQLPPAHA